MPEINTKNPLKVQAGLLGARKRWGEPRVVRLDSLTPGQRHLVAALIEAAKSISPDEKAPAPEKADAQEAERAADADKVAEDAT